MAANKTEDIGSSFGYKLIIPLVQQLDGTLDITNNDSTRVKKRIGEISKNISLSE